MLSSAAENCFYPAFRCSLFRHSAASLNRSPPTSIERIAYRAFSNGRRDKLRPLCVLIVNHGVGWLQTSRQHCPIGYFSRSGKGTSLFAKTAAATLQRKFDR